MRLVFCGTPAFSLPALEALQAAGHTLVGVFSQPDRPAGRGRKLQRSAVAQRAVDLGLPLFQPTRLDAAAQALLRELAPAAIVVVAYGLILPQAVLDIPPLGCINIHASLLPRWRGAAPIARAVEYGDSQTGICIMRMDAGLDTGPVIARAVADIGAMETTDELQRRLALLGAELLVRTLPEWAAGRLRAEPQPTEGATYARKLGKEEARLDWQAPARQLARQVRAFNPTPVAWTQLDGERIRIWNARALSLPTPLAPGTVLAVESGSLRVATGDGILEVLEIQKAGGTRSSAASTATNWAGLRFT
jgi:methionyl-tRNA formyltransferase